MNRAKRFKDSAMRCLGQLPRQAPRLVRWAVAGLLVLAVALLFLTRVWPLWETSTEQIAEMRAQIATLQPAMAILPPTALPEKDRLALEKDFLGVKKDLLQAEWGPLATIAQIFGGMVLLVGIIFTYANLRVAQRNQQIAEEGQITERFTRAVDQLASTHDDRSPRIETRLGGIYALERIARDSPRDHPTVMEVLTAYVRERSSRPLAEAENPFSHLPADLQATLTVIGRRDPKHDQFHLDLGQTNLQRADLSGAHLESAHLGFANLSGAHLWGAHLQGAHLELATMERAILAEAHLEGAHLDGAHLEGVVLDMALLEGAFLAGAHLEGAYLGGAHLNGTHLEGADLSSALGLTIEQIGMAVFDANTKLPDYLQLSRAPADEPSSPTADPAADVGSPRPDPPPARHLS